MMCFPFNLMIYSCYLILIMSPVQMHAQKQLNYVFLVFASFCQFLPVKTGLNRQMAKTSFCQQKCQPCSCPLSRAFPLYRPSKRAHKKNKCHCLPGRQCVLKHVKISVSLQYQPASHSHIYTHVAMLLICLFPSF